MPTLSIIIPTFNSAKTIAKCLESVVAQTFTDYEVIVQDGSQADDTAREIENFQERHREVEIQLVRESDRGPYDAMNKAMEKAHGEWLYFLGSDDELYDGQVLVAAMAKENITRSDVIYGNVQSVGDSAWGKSGTVYDGEFNLEKLLKRNICHQAIFYRAEFARKIGNYNTNYTLLADWDFNLRCWSRTKFLYVNITIAKYSLGGLSGSSKPDEAFFRDFTGNVTRYFDLSLLSPLLNSPDSRVVYDVIGLQEAKGAMYSVGGKVLRRFLRLRAKLGIG